MILDGISSLTPGNIVMFGVGFILIFLGIHYKMEPLLLIPIGMSAILANIPISGITDSGGFLGIIYSGLIATGIVPCLIFLGIGAMTDFSPLISNPKTFLLGAAAQVGIYCALMLALVMGFSMPEACAIGIIGGADGPTSIYIATQIAPENMIGPIAVAAYSYMSLVPLIQPPIIRALTTEKERKIKMPELRKVSKREKILFPIFVIMITCILIPKATPLIGLLMFGNLLTECRVVPRLSRSAQNEIINIATILLGLGIGSTMNAANFVRIETLEILSLGVFAFATATAGGVMFGKLMCYLSHGTVNPMIGAAGVSAVPMSARVVQKEATRADKSNFLLMNAMGPNVAGVIGSAVAAGVFISIVG